MLLELRMGGVFRGGGFFPLYSPCAPAEARRLFFGDFLQGYLLAGNLPGNFAGFFFWTHKIKDQNFQGKFRSSFREKIRVSKTFFRANFVLQVCQPNAAIVRWLGFSLRRNRLLRWHAY